MNREIAENFSKRLRTHILDGTYRDPRSFDDMVAEEVVLHTPRFWRPVTNRKWMMGILSMVPQAIEQFTYHRQWIDGDEVIMEFSGQIGEKKLQGIDIFTLNEAGRVKSLTVFIRPPNTLEALGEREDAMLKQIFGVTRQDELNT